MVPYLILQKKYGDFAIPFALVSINSIPLSSQVDKNLYIKGVEVTLSTGFESSLAVVEVGLYHTGFFAGLLNLNSLLVKLIKVGNTIDIKMGYSNLINTKSVFSGFIMSVEFSVVAGEGVVYRIECMDVKALMMNNVRSELKKNVMKYSDAVSTVMRDYSGLYTKLSVDSTDQLSAPVEQHRQSDYHFVAELAKKAGYQFYVVNGTVYFKKYPSMGDCIVDISPNLYLKSFSHQVSLSHQISSVTVRSSNEKDPTKPYEGKAMMTAPIGSGMKAANQVSRLISSKSTMTVIDHSITSQAQAMKRAQAELIKAQMGFVSGSFELAGLPELVPGKFVLATGFGKTYSGAYYLTQVTHRLHDHEYQTICQFESNKA